MKTNTGRLYLISAAAAALGLFLSINFHNTAAARDIAPTAIPVPTPNAISNNSIKVSASGGLRTATFQAQSGKVILLLPDDIRAGDTVSGTLSVEPDGATEAERANNLKLLSGYIITLWPTPPIKPGEGIIRIPVNETSFNILFPPLPVDPGPRGETFTGFNATLGPPITTGDGNFGAANTFPGIGSVIGGILPGLVLQAPNVPDTQTNGLEIPPLGQQGRPIQIPGQFDGSFGNTKVLFGPPGSTVPDFEKNTENVSGGFGVIKLLAESPRQIVIKGPTNFDGPIELFVQEGSKKTTAAHRNVGVRLSAPKTNLMRGEKTTVTVEVRGLQGIKNDVPLQLDSKGVITMDGGNFQNLRIKPSEITPDGRYTTNRAITGVQAGGFSVTATVIVRRFDFSLQDDRDPNRLFHFNSFTGDYLFACGGGSCRNGTGGTSGQPPAGSSVPPPPVTLTGTGKPAMKGCIITLSHNAPDRRIFARLDACTKSGDASVETTSPKTNFNITDKNTADNTAASPPPK